MISKTVVTGWGRTCPSLTSLHHVRPEDVFSDVEDFNPLIARGLGRGYGDCAVVGGGATVRLRGTENLIVDGDRVTVDAGVSLDHLLQVVVPLGLFVPVTPGTRYVTIGGAIAADVHGKNHHCDGTFGSHVECMEVVTPSGGVVMLRQTDELFWATVGGMGLTGVIARATIRMIRIETSRILERTRRFSNIDSLMSAMEEADSYSKYSVAWVDTLSGGKRIGRSVLSSGEHARLQDLPRRLRDAPLRYRCSPGIELPAVAGRFRVTPSLVRAFNEFWYRKFSSSREAHVSEIESFFHPLDRLSNWNIIYGRRGFVQYQFAVPDASAHVVGATLSLLQQRRVPAFLSVLKRFGEQNRGLLSFPLKGWTLAVDIPASFSGLGQILDQTDQLVVGAGGRVYLAKDSRLDPRLLPRMYPKFEEFRTMRRTVDPSLTLQSNLSRRLGL